MKREKFPLFFNENIFWLETKDLNWKFSVLKKKNIVLNLKKN